MIKHYFLCLSLTALLMSCAEPQSSSASVPKEDMSKGYVVLEENIDLLVDRFNNFEDSLKLVFIVGPT